MPGMATEHDPILLSLTRGAAEAWTAITGGLGDVTDAVNQAARRALGDRIDHLHEVSKAVQAEADKLRAETEPFGTAEQWSAINDLDSAARYLFSAGAWLARHEDRYGEKEA